MPLTLQIAAGIVFGGIGLLVVYVALSALGDWLDGSYMRKVRRQKRREARKAASG